MVKVVLADWDAKHMVIDFVSRSPKRSRISLPYGVMRIDNRPRMAPVGTSTFLSHHSTTDSFLGGISKLRVNSATSNMRNLQSYEKELKELRERHTELFRQSKFAEMQHCGEKIISLLDTICGRWPEWRER